MGKRKPLPFSAKLVANVMLSITVIMLASPINVLLDAAIALTDRTHHSITAPPEPRIRYEPGAEALTMLAAPELKEAIAS